MNIYKPVTASLALKGMILPGLWIGGILSAIACSFEGIAWHSTLSRFNEEAFVVFLVFSGVYALCSENLQRICEGKNCLIWGKAKEIPDIINIHAAFWMPVIIIACLLEGAKWISSWFMIGAIPALFWMIWGEYVVKGIRKNSISAEDFKMAAKKIK